MYPSLRLGQRAVSDPDMHDFEMGGSVGFALEYDPDFGKKCWLRHGLGMDAVHLEQDQWEQNGQWKVKTLLTLLVGSSC